MVDVIRSLLMECLEQQYSSVDGLVNQDGKANIAINKIQGILRDYES